MYDMSELNFFFLWYAGHKLIQRGFFRRHLDLGSMVLFLMYKQRKYLKTGVEQKCFNLFMAKGKKDNLTGEVSF